MADPSRVTAWRVAAAALGTATVTAFASFAAQAVAGNTIGGQSGLAIQRDEAWAVATIMVGTVLTAIALAKGHVHGAWKLCALVAGVTLCFVCGLSVARH